MNGRCNGVLLQIERRLSIIGDCKTGRKDMTRDFRKKLHEGNRVTQTLKEVLTEVGATNEQTEDVSNAFRMACVLQSGAVEHFR